MMTILLVEDNRLVAFSLKHELEPLGYDVHVAYSANEAVCSASKIKPDLILMDVNLNGDKDGIECMKAIHDEIGFTPNIYISGYAMEEVRVRAIETSPFGVLEKPVNSVQLVKLIDANDLAQ